MRSDLVPRRNRTDQEVEYDLAYVASLYVRGISLAEIAKAVEARYDYGVSITKTEISADVEKIRILWVNSALIDFDQHRARELAHLDELEAAYWKAWEESCKHRRIVEKVQGVNQEISGGNTVDLQNNQTRKVIEQQNGNPLYLQGIERCIEKRCKILGLFSPDTIRVDWRRDIEKLGWKPEDADRLKEQAVQFILATLEQASNQERIIEGEITDAEFDDE